MRQQKLRYNFSLKNAAINVAAFFSVVACQTMPKNLSKKFIEEWLTTGDGSTKLRKQSDTFFIKNFPAASTIEVDESIRFQTIDGFGYTLTGGSVQVVNELPTLQRKALLKEIFGKEDNAIGVSFLRISIGASDLNSEVFTYDDIANGQKDLTLSHFSLKKDQALISMLKEILKINPTLKIIAVPWTSPVWMKDNQSSVGGILKPEFYGIYAQYFVKYLQQMKQNGISIYAVCVQNEPLNPKNNPSLFMTSEQQKNFIKNDLGPAFVKNAIPTKIVLYDHNCDQPEYATDILKDPGAAKYIDGSAFHLYGGEVSAMGKVHDMFPQKNLYFTEQWTGSRENFKTNLNWHVKNIIIGTARNYSKIALEWNLANNEYFKPHTLGGCDQCKGAITLGHNKIIRNESYYIIAHASKFVPANSVRIFSTQTYQLSTVAFKTPQGKIVLIVQNDAETKQNFNIRFKNNSAAESLSANSVATFVF